MSGEPESWLGGAIEGVEPQLMPVAHALVQVGRDLERVAANVTPEELWARPGGAAPIGFHLQHVAGVLDRLFTYARGEELSPEQVRSMRGEGEHGEPPLDAAALLREALASIDRSLAQVRATPAASLLEPRHVGRKRLPSNVLGLLYHGAEHATRHTGQLVTTLKILRGSRG